jgi:hypothetical protein
LAITVLLSGTAWEVWAFSFQVVISSFRLLFVGALILSCIAAFSGRNLVMMLGVFVGSVACIAHGSGATLPLLMGVPFVLARRWRAAIVVVTAFVTFYLAMWLIFPGVGSGLTLTAIIDALLRPLVLLKSAATFIGIGLYMRLPVATWVGLAGLLIGAAVLVHASQRWLRGDTFDWRDGLYICLVLSALGASILAAILHNAYALKAGVSIDIGQFGASRYVPSSSALWLGSTLYVLRRTRISTFAVIAVSLYYFIYGAQFANTADRQFINAMRQAKLRIVVGTTDSAWLKFVYPNEAASRRIIDLAKRLNVSQ